MAGTPKVLGFFTLGLWAILIGCSSARIHTLRLTNERRSLIHLNSFGFYTNGSLEVKLHSLYLVNEDKIDFKNTKIGFSLSKSRVDGLLSYTSEESDSCLLSKTESTEPLTLFILQLKGKIVQVKHFGNQMYTVTGKTLPNKDQKGSKTKRSDLVQSMTVSENKAGGQVKSANEEVTSSGKSAEPKNFVLENINGSYSFFFFLNITSKSDEGLYNLNFHFCSTSKSAVEPSFSIDVEIIEKNPGGYLSAAEMPLPLLYIVMSGFFFTAAMFWVYILLKHRYNVFKIHWLMAALAFTKSISLIFHSINYYFINTKGQPIEGLAVMYYITHLLKGALLFITLALIGTGWAFVKYILSDKEKKIFMIVIPLQVLANVAYIIIESTEEGTSEYALWKEILFLVDLICCGAILFPVVWSIRHLQEASSTDGKAAVNLAKLKLFRHYYVMIVCYIYFTRIIAILLKVTVPFQWQWFYELLVEVSTLVFFVLTGYKFRPASNNPYLQLPQDEEDVEMDEVLTESGLMEGLSKVKKTSNGREKSRDSTV
ncbi:protein GPR108-like [Polypterus senegalus]|uniref:protein GPR108-like n=1 Tax=Polypterus senegalus TaxID=55291 RepID=UPI001962E939|nr:protein GPR108-like [Polypterus senegalus]